MLHSGRDSVEVLIKITGLLFFFFFLFVSLHILRMDPEMLDMGLVLFLDKQVRDKHFSLAQETSSRARLPIFLPLLGNLCHRKESQHQAACLVP